MRCQRQVLEPLAFLKFYVLCRDALRVFEVIELGLPVIALPVQQLGQIKQIGRTGTVVEPHNTQQLILPAEF